MKGLFYREWYLTKKETIMLSVITGALILLEILVMLSRKYGNIYIYDQEDNIFLTMYIFLMFIPPLICEMLISTHRVITYDYISKWNLYSYTFPISEKKQALVKFSKIFIGGALSVILNTLNYLLLLTFNNAAFMKSVIYYFIILALIRCFIEIIKVPLALRFKKDSVALGIITIAATLFSIVLSYVLFLHVEDLYTINSEIDDFMVLEILKEELFKFYKRAGIWLATTFVLITYLCFSCTVNVLKRRLI